MQNCDHITVEISAHRENNQERTRQLIREIKHTFPYRFDFGQQNMNFVKVFVSLCLSCMMELKIRCISKQENE